MHTHTHTHTTHTHTLVDGGLYLHALAHGLECTLDAYREALVRSEHEVERTLVNPLLLVP